MHFSINNLNKYTLNRINSFEANKINMFKILIIYLPT